MLYLSQSELKKLSEAKKVIEEIEKTDLIYVHKHERLFTCYRDFIAQSEDRIKNPSQYYYWRLFNQSAELKVTKEIDYYIECKGFIPIETEKGDRPIEERHRKNKIKDYVKIGYYKDINKAIEIFTKIMKAEIERMI